MTLVVGVSEADPKVSGFFYCQVGKLESWFRLAWHDALAVCLYLKDMRSLIEQDSNFVTEIPLNKLSFMLGDVT